MPKLSILVLTHNRAQLLPRCLDAIGTTRVDCEILVRDDASTDNTPQVMEDYARRDPRVKYFRNATNQGVNKQFALLTGDAQGEYLSVLPDDDLAMPGNFDKKVAILDAYPEIGFVYSFRGIRSLETGQVAFPRRAEQLTYSYIGGRNEFLDLMPGNYIPGNTIVWRKRLTDELGGLDSTISSTLSDWDLWMRYTHHTQTAYLNEPLVLVGRHANQDQLSGNVIDTTLAMLPVWRKWLIDGEETIVLDSRVWQRMRDMFRMCLAGAFPQDAASVQHWMHEFARMERQYMARVSQRFWERARPLAPSPAPAAADRERIVFSGPLWGLGAQAADLRGLVAALDQTDLTARVENLYQGGLTTDLPKVPVDPALDRGWQAMPAGTPFRQLWALPPDQVTPDPRAASFAVRCATPTDRLPETWLERCAAGRLLVPSHASLDACQRAGIPTERVRLLPGCVDVELFQPEGPRSGITGGRGFTFVSLGPWGPHKGWEPLLRAFVQEFSPQEDVALLLVSWSPFGRSLDDIRQELQAIVGSANRQGPIPTVTMNFGIYDQDVLAGVYRDAQACVQPSRGPAFSRCVLEAMATGLPVIATRAGANLDLLNDGNGYLLDCQPAPVSGSVLNERPELAGHQWSEPSEAHLRALLRHVFTNGAEAAARGWQAREDILARHSPAVIGPQLAASF